MNPQAKPEGLRQAMAWLHTWAGLLLGWLMFAIFLTGTLTFFRHEITLWMKPELQRVGPVNAQTLALAEARLRELAPDAQSWSIQLPDARQPALRLFWREPGKNGKPGRFQSRTLDPATGNDVAERKSLGGDFFYRFHFELRSAEKSRWILEGRWVVGVATMAMFVALLSGIVTHRRIFADFFTFRPGKGGQRAWLDAHNVSGVLVLPFYLLITFSGLMMFHTLYLPAGIAAAYGSDRNAYFRESQGELPAPRGDPATGNMPALPLAAALAQARAVWPDGLIEGLSVQRTADSLRIDVRRDDGTRLQYPGGTLSFDVSHPQQLRLLHAGGSTQPAATTYGVLYGLHMARFAGTGLRWALFGLGLLGTAMIATGLVLWSVKRRAQAARSARPVRHAGLRLVDSLNIASVAGLPLAIACYLMANRWLPAAWPERIDAELQAFFIAWGLALLWALVWPSRGTWRYQFALAAVVFAALPLASATAGLPHALDHARRWWLQGDPTLLAVELGWLGAAALLALVAYSLRIRAPARAASATSAAAVDATSVDATSVNAASVNAASVTVATANVASVDAGAPLATTAPHGA